jgi:DNA-binding transcriptional LysR family regulator
MDDFARIRTFIEVVDAGSFSAAARSNSSVSSVARQVKSLEDELGVRLINRSTRRLSLTEPGRLFYERARSISADLRSAKREAASFQDSVKGVLRVSLRVSTGTTVIVPALPTFLKQYPELSLDIALTDERLDLVANNIDVAVWIGTLPDSEIVARRLSPSKRIVCGSPAYFERHGVPQLPADLLRHNCLLFTAPSYRDVWEFAKDADHEEVKVHGNLRSANSLVLLSAAMADLGVIVVNEWIVRPLITQNSLVRVLGDYNVRPSDGDAELHVVFPSSHGLSRKVRVFVDFLVQLFEADGAAQSDPFDAHR